ncbi:MAG: RluA family pseudouridine synthase [Ruminococcaceae bacterium]|nr:RluA family pseudouridine synthase [Oscillospiraceae bacterium]
MRLEIPDHLNGSRVDAALAALMPDMSRSGLQKLIDEGAVTGDGKALKKNARVTAGQSIDVEIPEPEPLDVIPQDIPLDIVYEDSDLIVINKPRGLVVHPAAGHPDGTVVNALLFHCGDQLSGINGVLRPGIVHRIDRDTSGLLVIAKNDTAHRSLAEQIAEHHMERIYETIVLGNTQDEGTVNAPIGRHPTDRKRMAIVPRGGKEAVTHYTALARYNGWTHVQCRLETGRTHQIRVHMASIGHPVAGDPVYGPKKDTFNLAGQCLHARTLCFVHPTSGELMKFTSELPDYFTAVLEKLQKQAR